MTYRNKILLGAVHHYQYAGDWSRQKKLFANDGAANDNFGSSVDLIDNIVMIGASGDGDIGIDFSMINNF
jgi:hypothetical protein